MKKKILSTILLSAVVLSNLGVAPTVLADSVNSKGTVEVTEGNIKPPVEKPNEPGDPGDGKDPENPGGGPVIPDIPGSHNPDPTDPGDGFSPNPNPNPGPLAILGTSNLRFGTINTSASNIRKEALAARVWIPDERNEDLTFAEGTTFTPKSVGNYVQFGDVRTTANGYELTAKFTKQFTKTDDVNTTLENSTIEYTNGILTHEDAITPDIHPTLNQTAMTLGKDQAVKVVSLAASGSEGKGKGIYSVEYGQSDGIKAESVVSGNVAKGTQGKSIFLNVPSSTAKNMKVGNYEAIVEWTLTPAVP